MNGHPFRSAMSKRVARPLHRVGGYAYPVQGAVETPRSTLLAQIDTDGAADMMWSDCGTLYWLARPEDLAARRFEAVSFTWQCS